MWVVLYDIENGKTVGGQDLSKIGTNGKIAFIVAGSVMTIIALISLFGFIGAIARKRRFVKAYAGLAWLVFVINCVAAGFYFYAIFSGKNLFPGCEFKDQNNVVHECTISLPLWKKAISVALAIVELFVSLYIAVIIGRYVEQLENEEYKPAGSHSSSYTPAYYPPSAQEQGLLHSNNSYPYADASHSFGTKNA